MGYLDGLKLSLLVNGFHLCHPWLSLILLNYLVIKIFFFGGGVRDLFGDFGGFRDRSGILEGFF